MLNISNRYYFSPEIPCADPESFVRGGPTLTVFICFLVGEGDKGTKSKYISGPFCL